MEVSRGISERIIRRRRGKAGAKKPQVRRTLGNMAPRLGPVFPPRENLVHFIFFSFYPRGDKTGNSIVYFPFFPPNLPWEIQGKYELPTSTNLVLKKQILFNFFFMAVSSRHSYVILLELRASP